MYKLVIVLLGLITAATRADADAPGVFRAYSLMLEREAEFKVDIDIPDRTKRSPAVVLMHGCGGLARSSMAPFNWRKVFRDRGYVTLIVDSFSPRKWPANICDTQPQIGLVGQLDRIGEAYAASAMLRQLEFVDPDRIVVMGFSHGAGTALLAATGYARQEWKKAGIDLSQPPFSALVANYPWCGQTDAYPTHAARVPIFIPLLVQIGDKDDGTPAEYCQRMAAGPAFLNNKVFQLNVYPDAHHSFDSGSQTTTYRGCGTRAGACGVDITIGHSELTFRRAQEVTFRFIDQLPTRRSTR